MRKKYFVAAGLVLLMGCMTACGQSAKDAQGVKETQESSEPEEAKIKILDNEDSGSSEYTTYEFETYDGESVVIDSSNIVSQEHDDNPLESALVPSDAEVVAPGRDYVYLADDAYYYVEDAVKNLVTKANKGEAAAQTESAATGDEVFSCDDYSISYNPADFVVSDVRGFIQLLYCNESVQCAGSNEILISKDEGVTVDEIINAIAGEETDMISDGCIGAQEIPVKLYSRTSDAPVESDLPLTLVDSFTVMQCGTGTITIEVIRTVGEGDEIDMTIEGAFTHALETFALNN